MKNIKPSFIDSHAHMQFSAYENDRNEIIQKALDGGIWVINAGSNSFNSKDALNIAEKYDRGAYATVGIHPSHANFSEEEKIGEHFGKEEFDEIKMESLARHPKCVAVGECGLEYLSEKSQYANQSDIFEKNKKLQKDLFESHINLSCKVKKPLVIHCRNAYKDILSVLTKNKNKLISQKPALMHFFSGTEKEADYFLDMDFLFSFGGAITFPPDIKKTDFISLIKKIPLSRILLETDSPFVSPCPLRGKRNEPANLIYIAEKIAEIKKISAEEVKEATTNNALVFFALNK